MKWPERLPKGARFEKPVGHVDLFGTAAAAAGADMPKDRVMDGVDLVPFAAGQAAGDPHQSLYWRDGAYKVLLAGGWKLQVAERPNKAWLYNLAEDPNEHDDLALKQPDKVAELKAALAAIDAQQVKPIWPSLMDVPVFVDKPLGVPAAPGDEYIYWAN